MEIILNNIQRFSSGNFDIDREKHSMIDFELLHIDEYFVPLENKQNFQER